jgi:hypothetical protein
MQPNRIAGPVLFKGKYHPALDPRKEQRMVKLQNFICQDEFVTISLSGEKTVKVHVT